jgi:subtilisin family serine protease
LPIGGDSDPSANTGKSAGAASAPYHALKKSVAAREDARRGGSSHTAPRFRPNEVIVEIDPSVPSIKRQQSLARAGVRSVKRHLKIGTHRFEVLSLAPGTSVSSALESLRRAPGIVRLSPNYIRRPTSFPNDPLFSNQWGLNQDPYDNDIDAPEAWDTTATLTTITVAIIDTGVDLYHEDLRNRIWQNSDEIAGNGVDDDRNGYVDDTCGYDFAGISQEATTDMWELGDASGSAFAQTIRGTGGEITYVKLWLSRYGTPNPIAVTLRDSGPTGTVLASATIQPPSVPRHPGEGEVTANFGKRVQLLRGHTYAIVVDAGIAPNGASRYLIGDYCGDSDDDAYLPGCELH